MRQLVLRSLSPLTLYVETSWVRCPNLLCSKQTEPTPAGDQLATHHQALQQPILPIDDHVRSTPSADTVSNTNLHSSHIPSRSSDEQPVEETPVDYAVAAEAFLLALADAVNHDEQLIQAQAPVELETSVLDLILSSPDVTPEATPERT